MMDIAFGSSGRGLLMGFPRRFRNRWRTRLNLVGEVDGCIGRRDRARISGAYGNSVKWKRNSTGCAFHLRV